MKRLIAIILCLVLLIMGAACDDHKSNSGGNDSPEYTQENHQSYTVYVSRSGKIHKKSNCSGMKYYTAMSYSKARAAGYSHCQNCY